MPEFLRQDYHTRKRLKNKWRRPKGRQSKLRVSKGGSGVRPRIGFKKKHGALQVVRNISELDKAKAVLLASQLGSKKSLEIAKKADELGIKILNKRKLVKYEKLAKRIEEKKKLAAEAKKTAKAEKKDEKEATKKEKQEPKKEEKSVSTETKRSKGASSDSDVSSKEKK